LEPISDAQVEQLLAEVQGAMADIAEAWREKDWDDSLDDERDAAIDRAMARLRRVEEQLSGLRPAPG
jgi:F0F1-type ATP synthase membrane subunit b/b'